MLFLYLVWDIIFIVKVYAMDTDIKRQKLENIHHKYLTKIASLKKQQSIIIAEYIDKVEKIKLAKVRRSLGLGGEGEPRAE